MSSTTVPTVKAALITVLGQAQALSGIQVVWGHPGNALESEAVIVGSARGNQEFAALAADSMPRDETYTVDVVCSVLAVGTIAEAEQRAYVLATAVQDAVTADPHLGLGSSVITWAIPGEFADNTSRTDAGVIAEVLVRVDVSARLT